MAKFTKSERKVLNKGVRTLLMYYALVGFTLSYLISNWTFGIYYQYLPYFIIGVALCIKMNAHRNDRKYVQLCKERGIKPHWNAFAVIKSTSK